MGPCLYAHSRAGEPPENWQPLEEHLHAVARRASELAEQFSSADWAWNAGWLHDLGKTRNPNPAPRWPHPVAHDLNPATGACKCPKLCLACASLWTIAVEASN